MEVSIILLTLCAYGLAIFLLFLELLDIFKEMARPDKGSYYKRAASHP